MLQTMEQLNAVRDAKVVNGVDSPDLDSIDSTTPIVTGSDAVRPEDETGETVPAPELKDDKPKEEVKPETDLEVPEPPEIKEQPKVAKPAAVIEEAVQKRINEITRKRREAERERDYEKHKREQIEAELIKLRSVITPADKPKRENFQDDDEFFEALADWKYNQRAQTVSEAEKARTQDAEAKAAMEQFHETVDSVIKAGRAKYEDFDSTVLDPNKVLPRNIVTSVLQSDRAADVFYFLGSNQDIVEDMANLSEGKIVLKIGKIEAAIEAEERKLESESQVPSPVTSPSMPSVSVVKPVTRASAPIKPITTTGAIDKDPSIMSMKEYRAWREKRA